MNLLAVFLGGGLGSLLRYLISMGSKKAIPSMFPLGTLLSNVIACIILALTIGILSDKIESNWTRLFIATGFCGGFSTFSTFGMETFDLYKNGHLGMAIANILISLVLGLATFYFLWRNS